MPFMSTYFKEILPRKDEKEEEKCIVKDNGGKKSCLQEAAMRGPRKMDYSAF